MRRLIGLLKALTIGGLAGFIGGLLYAPQKGEKTREKVQEAIDQGRKKFEELKQQLRTKDKE